MSEHVHKFVLMNAVKPEAELLGVSIGDPIAYCGCQTYLKQQDIERQLNAVEEALEFVEMAGYADSSGGEYHPVCQECGGTLLGERHKPDCRLAKWIAALKSDDDLLKLPTQQKVTEEDMNDKSP